MNICLKSRQKRNNKKLTNTEWNNCVNSSNETIKTILLSYIFPAVVVVKFDSINKVVSRVLDYVSSLASVTNSTKYKNGGGRFGGYLYTR